MTLLETNAEVEAELDKAHAEISAAVQAIAERYASKGVRCCAIIAGMCREDEKMRLRSCGNMSTPVLHQIFLGQLQESGVAKVLVLGDEEAAS